MCFLLTYYFFIILSILCSKGVCTSYDEATSLIFKGNFLEKGKNSGYSINAATTTKKEKDDVSDSAAVENFYITPANDVYEKIKYSILKERCPHYKNGEEVELDKMSDVWQVVYYQLKEDIPCFKMYIKKTSDEEKRAYMANYGTFSNSVDWSACDLEIKINDKGETQRRHFLQRGKNGIMDNIIILEEHVPWKLSKNQRNGPVGFQVEKPYRYNASYILHPENPDQWLVVKNLLLMRDCDDGDVLVFSRVPHLPRRKDVMDALVSFGEYTMEGKMGCKRGKKKTLFLEK